MTAQTITGRVGRPVPVKPVRIQHVIHSEWVKISTLRSTWYVLVATVIGMVGIGAIAAAVGAAHWGSMSAANRATFSAVDTSLTGVALAQMIISVLGVLLVTGEYSTGMIRSSLSAVPRRLKMLAAKLVVAGALSVAVSVAGGIVALLVGKALLGSHGALDGSDAVRSLLGSAFYLMSITVFAGAVGFIVRSTAGGIAAVLGLLLVLPVLGAVLPQSWQNELLPFLPTNAGNAAYAMHPYDNSLSAGAGFVTLCVWMVVASVTAALLLRKRDA
ncbi:MULTISPECIES: ABC transporter permease subunit [Pseudofrankia]|uniref:ABC transporter permease subunit n=1 Tax=Pseudofrankia TaxID=2994363 RepID=UPI000234CA17|nr:MULTISPECIES: ABC transporter permease subunit [Pseudofrankia]